MQKERKINVCGKKENGDGWSGSVGWLVLRGRNGGVGFGVCGNFFCEGFCVEWIDWAFDEVIFFGLDVAKFLGELKNL